MEQTWTLYTMGCRGSRPASGEKYLEFGGATTCYILKTEGYAAVIDCGTGLYSAKEILADCKAVDVLLTHVHYDHIMGLLEGSAFPAGVRVRYFGEFDRWYGTDTLKQFLHPPFWPITPAFGELVPVSSPGKVKVREGLEAQFYPANHPDGASILRLCTAQGDICAAFDYEHTTAFPDEMAEGCELLIYDGMYTTEEYPSHVGWGHSCWENGCDEAIRLKVPRLLITHHNPTRDDEALRALERQAQQRFPNVRFARAGDIYHLEGRKNDEP